MHTVLIEPGYLGDVTSRFGHFAPHADIAADAAALRAPVCALGTVADSEEGISCPTLFLWLPEIPTRWLRALAESQLTVYNCTTADLQENMMFVSLQSPDLEVRWNAWEVDFPSRSPDGRFRIVLISGRHTAIALHRISDDAWDIMVAGMQGCGICSGPNYRPYALWSDEQMAEAEGRADSPAPGQMTARRIPVA